MGSNLGLASGFGKLDAFGMDQPVVAVCGDSTFFHATLPALVNAIHHRSNVTLVVFDNSGTAMTGFQPHPGLPVDAMGQEAPSLDIARICEAMGAKVETRDPFNLEETRSTLNHLMEQEGVKVLILRQICALSPEKRGKKRYQMRVEETRCLGEGCGCNRKMADLNGQASRLSRKTEYVTILMGANDVCTPTVGGMTDPATFRAQFETAMQTATTKAPKARIYVVSIPNVYNLWSVLKDNSSARSTWALFGICQSLLANPLSTAPVDADRR